MDRLRWERIRELVADALELPPGERSAFLARTCGGDQALQDECASLLAEEQRALARLALPWGEIPPPSGAPSVLAPGLAGGARVGRWTVMEELGSGGMGSVYLAERAEQGFVQRAALKVVGGGWLSAALLQRFQLEQRALARLEHPGIARLIDAGVADGGAPFLAMELVTGLAIDRWCRERGAAVRQRVELLAGVTDAVSYAHAHLVVHRDIKPANVLVDGDGRPRLVDFGIARVLDESSASEATQALPRAFTPRYASPEQVRGEPVTTASDVYSLGVLAFELLAGTSPYGALTGATGRTTREIERAVCEALPPRPSAAARESGGAWRALRGDLDAIVHKALAKEPARRYASAAELGADLRAHLAGEPVLARPDTLAYRLASLVRRHRLASVLAAAVVVALAAGVALATAGLLAARAAERREREQRELAERRYGELRELAGALVFEAHDAIRTLPGATAARESLLRSAQGLLERLEAGAGDDPLLAVDLARSHVRLGELYGRAGEANLGRVSDARAHYARAIELANSAAGREPRAPFAVLQARAKLGELLAFEGLADEARAELEAVLATREALAAADPERWGEDPDPGYLHERLFDLELAQGRLDEATAHLEASIAFHERATEREPGRRLWRENLALALGHRAKLCERRADHAGALAERRRSAQAFAALAAEEPGDARLRQRHAQAQGELGAMLLRAGAQDEARAPLEWALAEGQALCTLDPESSAYRSDLAATHFYLGELERAAGDLERSLEHCRMARDLRRAIASGDPLSDRAARELAVAADGVGSALRRLGRLDDALDAHREAHAAFARLAELPGAGVEARRSLAVSCFALGQLERARAETQAGATAWEAARSWYRESLAIMTALAEEQALAPRDAGVTELLAGELAACDAALDGPGAPGARD